MYRAQSGGISDVRGRGVGQVGALSANAHGADRHALEEGSGGRTIYYQLTGALKRRFIEELRRYWATHPKYRDELVPNIQGKFAFTERPQHGIIVKTQGGNRVDLSADNYVGIVESYCLLTRVKNKPGISVEWVREDSVAIQKNGGRFPSPPGFYYIQIDKEAEQLVFYVDPLISVTREAVAMPNEAQGVLAHLPVPGSLRLYELPSGFRLVEGVNYTLGEQGTITFLTPITGGRTVTADYMYPIESRGPFPIREMYANNIAIPGVVLAFGRRVEAGDQFAIMVHDIRRPAYLEYAGKWEISLDCDVMSRDVYAQQEIVDESVLYLHAVLRPRLSHMGIEITDISLGGESEEIYDENGDDYFYNATFSITAQTEWSIHVPIDGWLRTLSPLTRRQAVRVAGLSDDELRDEMGNIRVLESLGLDSIRDPFWSGRRGTFEMVK